MRITNKNNKSISSFKDWEQRFIEVDKKTHWREGYSAYSLGSFFSSGRGEEWLSAIETTIFGSPLQHIEGRIEHASKLDGFRGGQRMQDLAIWGRTPLGQSCFIGIEAKVLEPFGDSTVYDAYIAGVEERERRNPKSKKAERVLQVTDFLFKGKHPKDDEIKELRYQLMHYFKASALEAPFLDESKKPINSNRHKADVILLPVLVFNTSHYQENPQLAEDNHNDYNAFVNALKCEKRVVGGLEIYHKIIDGRDLYTVYDVVDLK